MSGLRRGHRGDDPAVDAAGEKHTDRHVGPKSKPDGLADAVVDTIEDLVA